MESRQHDPFEDAYLNYMRTLQDAWRPDEIQKRIDTANLEYLRGLADTMAPEDAPRRFEAFLQYQRALAEAQMPQEMLQRFDDAYRNYLIARGNPDDATAIENYSEQLDADPRFDLALAYRAELVMERAALDPAHRVAARPRRAGVERELDVESRVLGGDRPRRRPLDANPGRPGHDARHRGRAHLPRHPRLPHLRWAERGPSLGARRADRVREDVAPSRGGPELSRGGGQPC